MRLIDANKLMDYCNNLKSKTIDANDIARFPTAVGWISVKDRLPEEGGKYLVTVTSNVDGKPFVKTAWFLLNLCDNGQFKYECEPNVPGFYNGDGEGDWVERNVSHWMPLPEPPKE